MADQNISDDARAPGDEPPAHLSVEARRWWRAIVEEYGLDDPAGLAILASALEAWDAKERARLQLAKEGAVFRDRWGRPRAHPAVGQELRYQSAFLAAMKQLNLDLEPLRDGPGRPPGSRMDPDGSDRPSLARQASDRHLFGE